MKYLFLIGFCLITLSPILSQGLTEKYVSFDLTLGKKSIRPVSGDYSLSFTENSIRELSYNFNETPKSKLDFTDFKIGLKFGRYKGLSHELFFDVSVACTGTGLFGYSLGYNIAIEPKNFDILLRPSIGISNGSASYNFTEFNVDEDGIVLDDNDYIDTNINANIESNVWMLTPNMEFVFLYEQKFAVAFNVGYDYVLSQGEEVIAFLPDDSSYATTKANLTNDTYNFTVNTEKITHVFDASSIKFSIGISTYWNRD